MPAMMKGWLDRVWSAGWAYRWKHDPEGSLLSPRPCTVLCPMGASRRQVERWGYDVALQKVWRYGVFGYCGFEPIRIELLQDCAVDVGDCVDGLVDRPDEEKGVGEMTVMGKAARERYEEYKRLAFEAGRSIMCDPKAKPGINGILEREGDQRAFEGLTGEFLLGA